MSNSEIWESWLFKNGFTLSIPSMSMVIRFSWARSRSENATRWTISIPYKHSYNISLLIFRTMYRMNVFIPLTNVLQKYNLFVEKCNLTVAVSLSLDISSYMKCLTKSVMKYFLRFNYFLVNYFLVQTDR